MQLKGKNIYFPCTFQKHNYVINKGTLVFSSFLFPYQTLLVWVLVLSESEIINILHVSTKGQSTDLSNRKWLFLDCNIISKRWRTDKIRLALQVDQTLYPVISFDHQNSVESFMFEKLQKHFLQKIISFHDCLFYSNIYYLKISISLIN